MNRRLIQVLILVPVLAGLRPGLAAPPPASGLAARPERSLTAFLDLARDQARRLAGGRKIRLAVIPLRGSPSSRYADQGFGDFLTEKISSSMVSADSPIRVFERARLDAVLKEQALSASGLFDESEARKLGELAPIDDLITGSFTRLESAVSVNLRFIDVVTGEVRANLSETLALTPDLASLFEDRQARPATRRRTEPVDPCAATWAPIQPLMQDIGTPDKLDRLVRAAMAVPFAPPCGSIHEKVMGLLGRYKQFPPAYTAFLVQTLQKQDAPDPDGRADAIIHYLARAGQLDDPAWRAALHVASGAQRFSSYLPTLLLADPEGSAASRARLQARIGIILDQAGQKRIGQPMPMEPARVFVDVLSALRSNFLGYTARDPRPLMACYRTYSAPYVREPSKRLLELLAGMYAAAETPADRGAVMDWFAAAVNRSAPSRDLEEVLVPFLHKLVDPPVQGQKADPGAPAARNRLAQLCGARLAETIPFIVGRDDRLEVTGFCLEHGIRAPGQVPDLDALIRDLASADAVQSSEAVRLLRHMGTGARAALPAVLKRLRRSETQGGRSQGRDLFGLLGSMRTADSEAISVLLHGLQDQESFLADAAVEALAQIGEPAVPALKQAFPEFQEPYKQMRVLKVFQLRGPAAAAHRPWLRSVMAAARSPHVHDAAEDALDALGS